MSPRRAYTGRANLVAIAVAAALALAAPSAVAAGPAGPRLAPAPTLETETPIKHLVVIVPENQSFDHYFATYPKAKNPPGSVRFRAKPGTPKVNGLGRRLRRENPNRVNPFRSVPRRVLPCDPDHFMPEQQRAINRGRMNRFVEESGDSCPPGLHGWPMAYFDGNTVTAHWNYAQHFAMSDAFHSSVLGPSTPGHLNIVAGQTHGVVPEDFSAGGTVYTVDGTLVDDLDPGFDDCSSGPTVVMRGSNVGDLLDDRDVSWGYFQGGFKPTSFGGGEAECERSHTNANGTFPNYVPHHNPFQYYEQTANPHHLPPSSIEMIGSSDQANHLYAIRDLFRAIKAGNQPAVSFIKPPAYADGHAGYSDPIDEKRFLVRTINRLQRQDTWSDSAILILYDDSGGWYDHVEPPLESPSAIPGYDALTGPGQCGEPAPGAAQGRCGWGMRMPFIAISPFARPNHVDSTPLEQASVLRFIEDNWGLGRIGGGSFDADAGSIEGMFDFGARTSRLFLDRRTGAVRRKR